MKMTSRLLLTASAALGTATSLQIQGHAQTVPLSGLVGYWSGDGNANDSSSFANNGSFSGTYAAGRVGQAFQVNGGASYVSAPDIPAYSFSTAFSVGFWFYGSPTNGSTYLGQDNGPFLQNKWFVNYGYGGPGKFAIHRNGTGNTVATSAPASGGEAWHQLTVVKDGSAYGFFLDGSAIGGQNDATPFPDPVAPFTIGYAEPGFGFSGLIDEVVLYNRVLSASEVQQLAVPEPTTAALLLGGGVLLALRRRRRGAGV